jgi:catechol 2,3-dioxygenase-like lactoylglutathione lyase family enzyme
VNRCGRDGADDHLEDKMLDQTAKTIRPVLHHVNLKTTRLQEMIDWYVTVLGVEVNFQFPGGAFTSNDRANHRIAFLALPGMSEDDAKVAHAGLHHTAFEYAAFDDLMASFARLRGVGITPDVCLNHGLTMSLYYADPDGNLVELQVDNFGDWGLSTEWVRTSPAFAADPIGAVFDADQVFAAYEAGASFSQLRDDTFAGKFPPQKAPNLHLPL